MKTEKRHLYALYHVVRSIIGRYMDKDKLEEILRHIQLTGGIDKTREGTQAGGRLGFNIPLDESSNVGLGAAGHYAKGKGFRDVGVDRADVSYSKRFDNDSELRARLGANLNERAGRRGLDEVGIEYEIPFKKGGKVKAKAKVSKASKRGDGIARKGKTKGRMI